MIYRIISIIILTLLSSCGILGLYKDDVNRDPDFQAKAIAKLNNKLIAKEMDSLFKQIDSAPLMIPEDLNRTTLIIETYEYTDYLKTWENKYHTPKDNNQSKRSYKKYNRAKNSLVKNPKYKVVYVDKNKLDTLDIDNFRYVLKTTNRINYDPDHLTVANDGFVCCFVSIVTYYIYDRQNHKVFSELTDFSVLSKN